MKVWLDDIRNPARYGCIGWIWVENADAAIRLLASGLVTEISLDHDLALEHYPFSEVPEKDYKEKTGYDVICWMEENNVWPEKVYIHTMNPVGRVRMQAVLDRHNAELSKS